jgi:hypothetical protein
VWTYGEVHKQKAIDNRFIEKVAKLGVDQPMQGSVRNPLEEPVRRNEGSLEQQLADLDRSIPFRRQQFRLAWIEAERAHPILAAYRDRDADASKLGGLAGSDHDITRSVIRQVLPKLGNIYRTKSALLGTWGHLDPLRLAPAVEIAKQRMFVPPRSARDGAITDIVAEAHDTGGLARWAYEAIMLALTALTLVPSAGTSVMAGLAIGGLAYDVYAGVDEYQDYKLMSAAGDTDLDELRSISDEEPSLTPLLMRIFSAGVNLTIARGLFKRAAALRRGASATSTVDKHAIDELNKLGERAGVKGVGDEAARVSNATTKSEPAIDSNVDLTRPPDRPDPNAIPGGPPTKIRGNADASTRRSMERENEPAIKEAGGGESKDDQAAKHAAEKKAAEDAAKGHVHQGGIEADPQSPYCGKWNGSGVHDWDELEAICARDGYRIKSVTEDPVTGARRVEVERTGVDPKTKAPVTGTIKKTIYPKDLTAAQIDGAGDLALRSAINKEPGAKLDPYGSKTRADGSPADGFFEAAVNVGSPPRSVKIQGWFKETSDGTKVITSHAPAYDKSWPKVAPKDY